MRLAVAERGCKRIEIRGQVQGVGFRPFVYGLARELDIAGYVINTGAGVRIEVEGSAPALARFLDRLHTECPPLAMIDDWDAADAPAANHTAFTIRESDRGGAMQSLVLPDIATCAACLDEINDPENRRYQYPFTNCTHCGPRYSIITGMPYDRPYTTMAGFPLCDACRREYEDPGDRRFHAQPIACPACGPHLELWAGDGSVRAARGAALAGAVAALEAGHIVALKGLGGFQLLADARNEGAIEALRARKHREAKPFALMFPTLEAVRAACDVTPAHAELLQSPQAPIVLVPARPGAADLAASVAPDTYLIGAMLPYTPLHHLILAAIGRPLVATSGNRGEEPICIDEHEALERLDGIADCFLVHNRPIARQVDDAIVTVAAGAPVVLRRARGYAPAPLRAKAGPEATLAVGAHLKNAIAYTKGGTIFPGQHIGNLENLPALDAFARTAASMRRLFEITPVRVVHDLHPDYASTRFALEQGIPATGVQHHYAHVLSCMAEHGLEGPVLGVSWDGTGYGTDGTIWGGEFLRCTRSGFTRVASLRPFRLPGGDAAARDPRRCAFSLLYETRGPELDALDDLPPVAALRRDERRVLRAMLEQGVNAPVTTSMGRLFDAVASLCGLCQRNAFEGQAAMRLEHAAVRCTETPPALEFTLDRLDGRRILDWQPVIAGIIDEWRAGTAVEALARGFHDALAAAVVRIAQETGVPDIVLTGGCFQNKLLLEQCTRALETAGFRVYRHGAVPPNDGGIAIGQAWFRPKDEVVSCV